MLIRLPKNGCMKIDGDGRGIQIHCEEGVLWLTQTGDPNDYFLGMQQDFTIIRKGKVMLEALRDVSMTVVGT